MELQWNGTEQICLKTVLRQRENLEQVQEVRLEEGLSDIDRVICAWGQPVLRSKEWRGSQLSISGGISTWTLYASEDGGRLHCVEAWLPFQARWNVPDSRREGVIRADCCLRSVDSRAVSSRKLLVRASVGVLVEALEETKHMIYHPDQVPEGVQIQESCYPVLLPTEAGEKAFTVEETLTLQGSQPVRLCCCRAFPQVTEQEIVGSRGVFRGSCGVQMLYMTEDGQLCRSVFQIPFAQYAQLDGEYGPEAVMSVQPAMTGVETEQTENGLLLRLGMVMEYLVYERAALQVAEDAYGLHQAVEPVREELALPVLLDQSLHQVLAQGQASVDEQPVDVSFCAEQPTEYGENGGISCQLAGCFQVLYYDENGMLQCRIEPWDGQWQVQMAESCQLDTAVTGLSPVDLNADRWETVIGLEGRALGGQSIAMVKGLQVGEAQQPDPKRPTLVLRRMGDRSLWELAKDCGSTVEAIRSANDFTEDPPREKMLLIPVL